MNTASSDILSAALALPNAARVQIAESLLASVHAPSATSDDGNAQLTVMPHRRLSDVVREIAAEQRSRDYPGRTVGELQADDDEQVDEDTHREQLFQGKSVSDIVAEIKALRNAKS